MPTRVLLVMLDGCRPDALAQADTPCLDALIAGGAYSDHARSVVPSVTLPCHNSIFRSVPPALHGVGEDNIFQQSARAFTSIVDQAALYQKRCAFFTSWEQLRDLSNPGSLAMSWCRNGLYGEDNDSLTAEVAAAYLSEERPDLTFLYFGDIDIHGHMYGWMSPEQRVAIRLNDRALVALLDRLTAVGVRDEYTLIVLADHGGHDDTHGTELPEDMTIPLLLHGPGVRAGLRLSGSYSLLDIAPTLAHLLDIPAAPEWQGQVIREALL